VSDGYYEELRGVSMLQGGFDASGRCLRLRFIAHSSPCVCLVGVSAMQLENSSFQPTNHNQHRNHIVVRLLAEGSVVVVLMVLGWWGMANLGSSTLASQSDSLTAEPSTIYVGGCPVPDPLEKGSVEGGAGKKGGAAQRRVPLTRSPHASLEWD